MPQLFMNFVWLLPQLVQRILHEYGRDVSNDHITNLCILHDINPPMIVISDIARRFIDRLVIPEEQPFRFWETQLTQSEYGILVNLILGVHKTRIDLLDVLVYFVEYHHHIERVIQFMIIKNV